VRSRREPDLRSPWIWLARRRQVHGEVADAPPPAFSGIGWCSHCPIRGHSGAWRSCTSCCGHATSSSSAATGASSSSCGARRSAGSSACSRSKTVTATRRSGRIRRIPCRRPGRSGRSP
jgi:hypothetical protein